MRDALEMLGLPPGADLPLRCPRAQPITTEADGPSVICTVIAEANRREPAAAEVPPLVSGRRSPGAVAMFCCGRGVPGEPITAQDVEEIGGRMAVEVAVEKFCYTDCPSYVDEWLRQERAKTHGVATPLVTSGVVRG